MTDDDNAFREALAPIVVRHMKAAGSDPEKLANIYETLASTLGTTVAQGCKGDARMMGEMLEGLCSHVMEVAADRAPIMAFLGQFKK